MIQTSLRSSLSFVRASFCQGGYSWATYTTPYSGRGGTLPVDDFYTCAENKETLYTTLTLKCYTVLSRVLCYRVKLS